MPTNNVLKSSVKLASKSRVKAKKAVSASGYGSCKKKTGYGFKKKSGHGCKPAKKVCKKVKYVCKPVAKKRGKRIVRRSAFRAVANAVQAVPADTLATRVAFGQEIFDLGGEYNPATSTFRAKQNGVYTFFASVFFVAAPEPADEVEVTIVIRVNNETAFGDTETLPFRRGVIDTSGIVNLRRGDEVQVLFFSSAAGFIQANVGTHFDGALTRLT